MLDVTTPISESVIRSVNKLSRLPDSITAEYGLSITAEGNLFVVKAAGEASAWYNRACSKVKKGDIEDGLDDLKKAIGIDKNYIELAKQDKDFGGIRNDERFKALVML